MFFVWRSNLLGSSGKGQEYFLRHLLGAMHDGPLAEPLPEGERPAEVRWREEIPHGKLDLLVNVDFRMTTTGLYSDIVLPAATWYEKHDLSMTDMHPFVHSFNQAVPPPWEARTDWDCFGAIARAFSQLAAEHLGVRRDIVPAPVLHDTPGEIASRAASVRDWRAGECEPVPGRTMPELTVVERDYGAVAEQWAALGPLAERLGSTVKSASWMPGSRGRAARRPQRPRSRRRRRRPARRSSGPSRSPRRSSRSRASRTAGSRSPGFRSLEERCGVPAGRPRRGRRGDADHVPGHAGAAAARDHLARVVGDRRGGPRLRRVHDQRRAREALAHALGPHAPLPRPRLDARARREPARLPAAGRPPADARRRASRSPATACRRSRCAT